ncbi:hypothetical protein PC121_g10445 [Phytophthora cactorum]|nr:hypothetical protein PC121_g10445 [Phytophthora cactorum]
MHRGRELDEVAAALADVQARQQSLARGSVLSRASSPSPSVSAVPSPSPSPPPVSKEKTQRAAAPFLWLKRRVVRCSDRKESDALEDLGSLELVSSASLASVRALIGQFIVLPPRREFVFVHPTTNMPVTAAEESDICAGDLSFICLVLLPVKEPPAARDTSTVSTVTISRAERKAEQRRPETAHTQQQPEQKQLQPHTVAAGVAAAVPSDPRPVPVVKRDRVSPGAVRTGRERQVALQPVQEERKQPSIEAKTEAAPLRAPTKLVESKRAIAEVKLALDSKRASSANLPERLKPRQTKITGQDTTDRQGSERLGRRRVASAGSDAVATERKGVEEKLAVSLIPEALHAAQDKALEIVATSQSSPSTQQQVREGDSLQQTLSGDTKIANPAPEIPTSLGKTVHQTPGHLHRSRRFKALTAEKSWGCEEPEEQELATDAEVEDFLQSFLEIVRTGLEDVDARQLDTALLYYGVDYCALKLNGVLLGLDTELGTRCTHVRGGVDGQLQQYLLKIFPVEKDKSVDLEALQRFEFALNVFTGMRGWRSPTQLRANYFEEKHPLQLIPASDSRRLAFLHLSDRDRQLFALASSDDPTVQLESWLADGMEITYLLLYGFLQSRRNSGPKSLVKLDSLHSRQDRIQAAIQKLSSFSFDVWKRLEFRTTDIEDTSMVRRLNEVIRTFLRDSKRYCGDLEESVFFPALVGYLNRKNEQLAQSLSGLLSTPGAHGPHKTSVLECSRLLRQHLEQSESQSTSSDAYLQSMGLQIIDVDKINASRNRAGLGRLYVNGRESSVIHYQCNLMANETNLLLKARWEQQELLKGTISRYCFHGPKEDAFEYVFVRTKLSASAVNEMRWEDRDIVGRKEAQHAFALLCGDSLEAPGNVAIGVGVNIIHADLLPHITSMISLNTILREYSGATSISFGYCYTPAGQAARVVFRVHTDAFVGKPGYVRGSSGSWGLLSAVNGVDRFLRSAQEEEANAFCEADGLRFLNSFLQEWGQSWTTTKYGKPFFDYIYEKRRVVIARLREDLLQAMKRVIAIIPRVPQSITKTNISIIVQMIESFPDVSDVADEAIGVLMTICSNTHQSKPTKLVSDYFAPRMTENQKQFTNQAGLDILKNAATKLQNVPAYKESVETAILCLLMTHEISATKTGLLIHWQEWLNFYVENGAWTRQSAEPALPVFLLIQVHAHFFTATSIVEPDVEKCPCGCDGHLVEFSKAFVGVTKMFRYMDFNHERQSHAQQKELDQDDPTVSDPSSVGVIWESNEWNDPSRAMAEKLANHLKLLVVLSSMTRNIVSIGNSDELREIILLLVRFVRERIHSASPQTTLYLLSLRNLIWATRAEILKWGISDLIEPSFLRKLLLLAKDKLYQDLPAGILWGLADAYEKSNMYLLSFEVDDALATGSYFTKKIGFAVMVDNLASKLAANRSIENDCGAMASMIANPASSSFFLTNYGYPFVLKIMESILRLIRAGHTHAEDKSEEISPDTIVGEAFGPMLSYSYAIVSQQERELLQLCRAALRVLEAMQRISPESVLDEAARTKTTILPLLDYPNKLVAQYAVLCCSTHLQTHPTQCGKLVENDVLDKVIAFFFEDEFPPIQVAAFSCIKLVFADHKYLAALQSKLFPLRERIVSCLHSPDFEVKRKAVLFLAEAVFRLDDQTFLDGFAEVFAAVGNNGLIMELFDSVSKEIALNPSADSVLQLLVRLMIKLNLVARTGGDQLVHVICLTLKTHKKDTFLRPVLFNFLHLTVAQGGHVEYLERKSRLDVVTGLLSQQLTLSELRDVANILILVATNHTGIRHYLSGFESGCIPKIAGLLSEFSEYSLNSDNSKSSLPAQDGNLEDHATEILPKELLDEGTAKYLLKVTTAKTVFISHFTEDIYELFLRLLLLLLTGPEFSVEERYGCVCESDGCSNCDPCDIIAKTRCGHYILRLSATHRVLCPTYDLEFLLSAKGDPADKILSLIVKVLEVLAINHQCRVQMLRGSMKADWFWVPVLAKNSMIPGFLESDGEQSEGAKHREESTADTIQLLGHLSAVKEVAQRLMIERPFVSMLFTYLTPTDQLFTSNVAIRRASAFTLARLAEFPLIVRDTFFQENMAMISYASLDNDGLQVSNPERDTVVLANEMILTRNQRLLTPGLQGRSVDDGVLSLLVRLLVSEESDSQEVGVLAGDVLAGLLYFQGNSRDGKRLYSVLWHYTRALSPSKSNKDLAHPSSKRLTAYLHNWIGPMLQKLRQSSFGTFHEDTAQLLSDELAYTDKHLEETSGRELLRVLVSLLLSPTGICGTMANSNNLRSSDLDIIQTYSHERRAHLRPRSLQYVFNASDRSMRESNDYSFHGSAHLWLFLRKLWELSITELSERKRASISEVRDIVVAIIPRVLTSWNRECAFRYSAVAFDRRKCFLDFVIAVGKWDLSVLSVINAKTIVEIVVRNGGDAPVTMGREYLLLKEMCQHIPENIGLMMKCFGLDCVNDPRSKPSDFFRMFWSPAHLKLLPVKFTLAVKTKMTILDPSPDAELVTIFGIDLLKLLSSRIPLAAKWFVDCQGETQLLDMMLLASKASALQMQHPLVRSFLSNLLWLTNQLLELDHATYQRIFTSDPRFLRCVVDLIYAPAHEVQTSAIKLLRNLAQQPRIFTMLSRLENVIYSIGTVSADVISYAGEKLNKCQISPPLSQDCVALFAHLSFVPFFTDLSVTELVKLSLGFRPCRQPEPLCWMILMNDGRFSSIPEWMFAEQSNTTTMASFTSAMKRIQKRFEGFLGVQPEKASFSMYTIDQDTYITHTSATTRRRVARRLDSLLKAYTDDSTMYRGSVRTRNGLAMRLALLRSDQNRTPEVVGCHLSCAISHRVDFLFRCGYDLDLNLVVAQALARTRSGNIIGMLQLFITLSSDELLCEQVWEHVINSADAFDRALELVEAAITGCFDSGNTSDLEVYCKFLYMICTSGINPQLDLAFRHAIQSRFGILLVLLQRVHELLETHSVHIVLRCIGSVCIDIPSNYSLVATCTDAGNETGEFVNTIVNALAELESHLQCQNVVGPLEIQATFSCIDAITSVPDQNDRFETRNLVVTALLVIQLITTRSHALDTEMTVAIQSVMKVLLRVVSGEDNDYLDALNEARTLTLVAGYELISQCYSVANDNIQLLRLLECYTALLDALVTSPNFRDMLWTAYFNGTETSSSFIAWVYQWILFEPSESPRINALNPSRASKRARVLEVAGKMQALTLSVVIRLTEHPFIVEELSLHPKFPMVTAHICTALEHETRAIGFGRAVQWVKFLCFVLEQWEEAASLQRWQSDRVRMGTVKSFLAHVKIPVLLQACGLAQAQEDSFVCYAIRFLWLIVKLQIDAGNALVFVGGCDDEWIELIPLASGMLKSSSSSMRSKCYLLGLLAEQTLNREILPTDMIDVVDLVYAALRMLTEGAMSRETVQIVASRIIKGFLSTQKWEKNAEGSLDEDLIRFGITLQSQRFVLHLTRIPQIRTALFHSESIHPLVCQTLFQDAIAVLSVKREHELWTRAQVDACQLINSLLKAADEVDRNSVLRSYRLVARRGQFLKSCINLLSEPWKPEFQCIIVESMITYLDRNVSGGAEVATLRKQGQGDLMALLLSIIDAEDAIQDYETPSISVLCLRLYNSIIEFSLDNARYAVRQGFSELCRNLREAASRQDTLVRCDLVKMGYFVVRMVGNSNGDVNRSITKEIWEITTAVLLHPLLTTHWETTTLVLEILRCCTGSRKELQTMIAREWDERGKHVTLCLANLLHDETLLNDGVGSERDLIEVLWWEVSTSNSKVETMKSSELRDLWYSLLNELCCNRDSALAIMEKDFLERFIVLESSLSNSGLLQDPANTSFLRLVSSVFHATNLSDHERYFKKAVPTMEILAELCLCTIVCIFDMNEAKWNATEVLYALAMHQDTLIGVWKACYLYPTQISDAALVKGTERLCAVSEMLLQCGNNVADLILVLTAVLKICRQSIDILIRARNLSECWPMIDVLVQVLQQCISDPSASSRSYLRPIVLTTSNPADFLPYYFPTELHVKATVLALQLVQLCLADRQFTESLETESDLLRNLFVCIATSNWRVASAAAIELSTLIHCDPDVTNPEDDEDGVTRYMCDQGDYRYLEFFSDFATQEVVRVAPSSRFPPCFVLLVRWLRFYSVNVTLLSDVQMVEDFAQELESTKELAETTQLDVHEKFAGSILEILLYLVANYHSVIYTSDNSESEEKEHSLFLQSLLALCQRRPRSCLDNADTCIVSSCRVRSRALKLVQLLCSIDLPHTRSVQVFSNPQQMQILMMIVENSTSDVEQNSAAQLMEALALKDPVKNVLIRDTSLLFRLGAWLEIDKLQLLAAAIIQRLATPSSSVLNRSVFGFSPSIQQQLAHFLIVGVEQKKPSQVLPKKSKPLLREVYRLRIEMQLEEDIKRSPRQKSSTSLLSVQLRLEIVDQSGLCLRQFEYQATVRSGDEFCYHEFLMEPAASIVRCTILTRNAAEYEDPKVRELELSRGIGSSTHRCDSVLLRFSEEPLRTSSVLSGILSRLLRQEIGPLSFEFFQALSGIVAEFCRDYSIFCDPVVDLPSQILVVLATSVEFAPAGKMDVTCLENLTTWFPNKPTVSNFKSIAPPVLHLIQNLRQLACIGDFTENLNYGSVLDSSASNFPQFWFLEKFVEFIGDVEVQDLTANVLNALFIENSDLLLYVCGQFNSEQSSETTFLSLVAIAIRRNVAHCQSFLSPTAQTLLRSVFDAGIQKSIRVATQNARVLMAFHSMTSLALDFYIDTAKKLQNQKKSKLNSKRRVSAIVNIGKTEQTVFLEWLLLLEQLAGLLCSGLHELDAVYYMEIVSQFRSLILDLPLFLRKMECMGTHSRREALMLFLDNLHRLVKRATNRNELRVVAANGSGIVDQTKAIRARLRKLDVHISTSLAALLEAREGMENLSRLLLAMQYMWRRMMGTTSVEKAMASSRESISLLKKIKEKFVSFTHALRRPRAVFGARHETSAATEFDSPSELLKASQGTESKFHQVLLTFPVYLARFASGSLWLGICRYKANKAASTVFKE